MTRVTIARCHMCIGCQSRRERQRGRQNVRIVWEDERQKLADWNAGKPMPGGMY